MAFKHIQVLIVMNTFLFKSYQLHSLYPYYDRYSISAFFQLDWECNWIVVCLCHDLEYIAKYEFASLSISNTELATCIQGSPWSHLETWDLRYKEWKRSVSLASCEGFGEQGCHWQPGTYFTLAIEIHQTERTDRVCAYSSFIFSALILHNILSTFIVLLSIAHTDCLSPIVYEWNGFSARKKM